MNVGWVLRALECGTATPTFSNRKTKREEGRVCGFRVSDSGSSEYVEWSCQGRVL